MPVDPVHAASIATYLLGVLIGKASVCSYGYCSMQRARRRRAEEHTPATFNTAGVSGSPSFAAD